MHEHMKSPFFHVDEGLESIRFFDYMQDHPGNAPNFKASSKRLGLRGTNARRGMGKDTKVSIHTSGKKFSNNFSKRFTDTMTFGKKNVSGTRGGGVNGSGRDVGGGYRVGPSSSELNMYIEREMDRFERELAEEKLGLIISQEEYKVWYK